MCVMIRTDGFYWVKGYKWSDEPRWFIAQWMLNSWWYDGDDFGDDSFIEIDETLIVREQKTDTSERQSIIYDVNQQRKLLLSYERHFAKQTNSEIKEGDLLMIEDFLKVNNC